MTETKQERSQGMAKRRPLRILYLGGPGDVAGTYEHWKQGHDDPSQVAVTYSAQFYELCTELGASGYIISYHPRRTFFRDGNSIVEHRPVPLRQDKAALYWLGQWWSGLRYV